MAALSANLGPNSLTTFIRSSNDTPAWFYVLFSDVLVELVIGASLIPLAIVFAIAVDVSCAIDQIGVSPVSEVLGFQSCYITTP